MKRKVRKKRRLRIALGIKLDNFSYSNAEEKLVGFIAYIRQRCSVGNRFRMIKSPVTSYLLQFAVYSSSFSFDIKEIFLYEKKISRYLEN